MEIERRTSGAATLELRNESQVTTIGGLGAPYGQKSELLYGLFTETIDRGAFKESLSTRNIFYLVGHDDAMPVAMTKDQTLRLWETDMGLYTEAIPNETQYAKDMITNVRQGIISNQSVGMLVEDDEFLQDKKTGAWERTIHKASLYEVSAVVWPAYPQTNLGSVRSMAERFNKAKQHNEEERKRLQAKLVLAKQKQKIYFTE